MQCHSAFIDRFAHCLFPCHASSCAIESYVEVVFSQYLVEYFAQGRIHFGMISLGAVAVGIDNIYLGIKMKKYGKVAWGSVMLLFAAICILIFIVQVVSA